MSLDKVQGNKIYCFPRDQSLRGLLYSFLRHGKKKTQLPALEMLATHGRLAGNSLFVRYHVTMNQPMNSHIVLRKTPALKQYFCLLLLCLVVSLQVLKYPETRADSRFSEKRVKLQVHVLEWNAKFPGLKWHVFPEIQTNKQKLILCREGSMQSLPFWSHFVNSQQF